MYELFLYEDRDLDISLSIKFKKDDPKINAKKQKMVEWLEQMANDIKKTLQ